MMPVRLSVMEVLWRIVANLGFKFRSYFTVHCGCRAAGGAVLLAGESSRAMLASARLSCCVMRQRCSWQRTSRALVCLRSSARGRPVVDTRSAPSPNSSRTRTSSVSSSRTRWADITRPGRVGWAPPATTRLWWTRSSGKGLSYH